MKEWFCLWFISLTLIANPDKETIITSLDTMTKWRTTAEFNKHFDKQLEEIISLGKSNLDHDFLSLIGKTYLLEYVEDLETILKHKQFRSLVIIDDYDPRRE